MNKAIRKSISNYFLIFLIITIIILSLFLINLLLFELPPKNEKQTYKRNLELNQTYENLPKESFSEEANSNENLSEETDSTYNNKKDKDKDKNALDNFYLYLISYYIIFIMMSIYIICIVDSVLNENEELLKEITKQDFYMFLYFSNNGSLLISIIFLSAVYKTSGLAPFVIGLAILIIGTIYYIYKLKKNCVKIFFDEKTIKYLVKLPYFIILLVPLTFSCCRCNYSGDCCTKIIFFFWNATMFLLKIITTLIMVLIYYIFLVLFILIKLVVQFIYKLCKGNDEQSNNPSENVSSNNNTIPTANSNNVTDGVNNSNLPNGINQLQDALPQINYDNKTKLDTGGNNDNNITNNTQINVNNNINDKINSDMNVVNNNNEN